MSKANSVVAIYKTRIQAEEAAMELQRSGFDMKNVSVVANDYYRGEHVTAYHPVDRMKYWGGPGLYSIGIPKDSILKYESALKSGRFLVLAHGSGDQVSSAQDIVQTTCPMEIAIHVAEQQQRAGTGASESFYRKTEAIRLQVKDCVKRAFTSPEENGISKGVNIMFKSVFIVSIAGFGLILPALASDREDDMGRIQKATKVFEEVMRAPDQGIPQELLETAKCVAIIPGEEKAAFIFGGSYGKGLAVCRTAHGWSAPLFLAVGGGSFGFQIGGSFTDVVLLFMNDHALKSLLSDKFKIGADATVAAGPVGRNATAGTDLKLNAEILSYSRSKGAFAGVSLTGAVVQADKSGDVAMYGANVTRHEILSGEVKVPAAARGLETELDKYGSKVKSAEIR